MKQMLLIFLCALSAPAWSQEAQKPATTTEAKPDAKPDAKPAGAVAKPATPRRPLRADRLDLETTVVTGNRELPKVLYIVPWKKAELGELPAQPFNTLLDEVLQPVDRDVFRREVKYFHTIQSGADAASPAPPAR